MFLYNQKHNFIHVDIPLGIPAVSTTIKNFIGSDDVKLIPNKYKDKENILPYFCYSVDLKNKIGEENWNNTYTFGVVRNPYDYMIALWEYYVDGPSDYIAWCKSITETSDAVREQYRIKSRGFDNWLLEDKDYDYLHSFPFCGDRLTSQTVWLSEVNDIFSFENTTPLLKKLFELTEVPLPSFKGDVPLAKDLKKKRAIYFGNSKKAVDLIGDSFKKEIEMFNYTCF